MLLQLTNKCYEGCPHCLQDAQPDGPEMSLDVFRKSLEFGEFLGTQIYVLSGGEPTEHSNFHSFCLELNDFLYDKNALFCITSNGLWIEDKEKCDMIEQITSLDRFGGMQVFTSKKWYKDYDYVVAHRKNYEKFRLTYLSEESIAMKDLGRARENKEAQEECDKSQHFMSCLNTSLVCRQIVFPSHFGRFAITHKLMCHPLVDIKGNIHLSESWLCPSVGNIVNDNYIMIWKNMVKFTPCLKCKDSQRFLKSERNDIKQARELLNV